MIFSEHNCPLCGQKLESKFIKLTSAPADKISMFYSCPKLEIIRNFSNTAPVMESHYTNEVFNAFQEAAYIGKLCRMIIPPFVIDHSTVNNLTSVWKNDGEKREPQKLIFRVPLLDMDYSRPHIVVSKLKVLVTFS